MKWPLVSRARFDLLRESYAEQVAYLQGYSARIEVLFRESQQRYHELRVNGADPLPNYTVPNVEWLGPLTRAALSDMGHGQSGIVKRGMRARTESVWLENRGHENQDELTAIAVRQGETR